MAKAFYRNQGRKKPLGGFITFEGEYYSSDRNLGEMKSQLFEAVFKQLKKCPGSLILFDEVEKVNPQLVAILEPFIDKKLVHHAGSSVSTSDAIFIFTSDFGYDGLSRGKSYEDLELMVRDNVAAYWHSRKKLGDLMQIIVPFVALDTAALESIFHARLRELIMKYGSSSKHLESLCYDQRVAKVLAKKAMKTYPEHNGRGVDLVLVPLVDSLVKGINRKDLKPPLVATISMNAKNKPEVQVTSKQDKPGNHDEL